MPLFFIFTNGKVIVNVVTIIEEYPSYLLLAKFCSDPPKSAHVSPRTRPPPGEPVWIPCRSWGSGYDFRRPPTSGKVSGAALGSLYCFRGPHKSI
ncbi:hypothetical protein HOLleu_21890 [Holothuria leucospilota]|uniref:Uncharacterized protein n=1 Tax=Holothuria leucospilota TaxID=206669 RepID=A0A9Q1H4A8_HOLLE|nr:hypothetical protein HOLleu_21890 [Holothuria leucospilota]